MSANCLTDHTRWSGGEMSAAPEKRDLTGTDFGRGRERNRWGNALVFRSRQVPLQSRAAPPSATPLAPRFGVRINMGARAFP